MIESLINRTIDNRWIVLGLTLVFVGFGLFAAVNLPVDAYPDISPQKAWIVTSYPGRAAEEVERQVTIPIEIALRTLPRMLDMRSDTIFGLSAVYVVFEDGVDSSWARQQVYERLNQVELPRGAGQPELVPDTSACGEIYRYELVSDGSVDVMELRTLNEWVVIPTLFRTSGVAGVYNFGGLEKRYSVIFRPAQLLRYNLSLEDVIDALEKNNIASGGGILPRGSMELVIRGTGVIESTEQIKNVFVKSIGGTPILVKDVASVEVDHSTPWSIFSKDRTDESVEGVVQMRRGENPSAVLLALKENVAQLNEDLPDGVQIVPFYDRQDLVDSTIGTVTHSVSIGITLVLLVLLLLLGRPLMALLVAATIPFSLLFAFCLMYLTDIPIGLLSIGAIDFGIIVEGTVIMADAIARRLGTSGTKKPEEVLEVVRAAALDMCKPVLISLSLIMMAFLPLLTLTRIEGLLFRPLALTIIFALMGALVFSLFIAPVLACFFFRWGYRDWDNPMLKLVTPLYIGYVKLIMKARYLVAVTAMAGLIVLLCELVPKLGIEFLPYMDEGGIWVRSQFPEGMSLQQTHECGRHIRQMIREEFPDIDFVTVQVGRADDSEPYTASRMELM
ncbi:MAG: efflux RND transporter permease subunit, partial [Planctomycetaceae bacterium]|nr:efflux RND transporter permease subunit [Planctomycetaceae bacterium]